MGTLKVILKQDVDNLGEEGDVKQVTRGYARNYLFPNQLAVDYSLNNRKILERQKTVIESKRLQKKENAGSLKEKLEQEKIEISISAGEKGRLYGTVTTSQIAEELTKKGFTINKKEIELKEHIKFGGNYSFTIHLYHDIYAEMSLNVIAVQEEKKADNRKKRRRRSFDENRDSEQNLKTATDTEINEEIVEPAGQAVQNEGNETALDAVAEDKPVQEDKTVEANAEEKVDVKVEEEIEVQPEDKSEEKVND